MKHSKMFRTKTAYTMCIYVQQPVMLFLEEFEAISACATGSGWPLSLQLMAAMGEYVDVIAMSGALSACERGSWEGAVALLGVMLRCRIGPDDACFQSVP